MPCTEFTAAIAWSQKSTGKFKFPVTAYFTKHFGPAVGLDPDAKFVPVGSPDPTAKDAVHYASGDVVAVNKPTPHLMGTLNVAKNTEKDGEMVTDPSLTYDVEIFPDGTLSYLMKINKKPVGGLPATKVKATCVNNVLLTATTGSEVVVVGVARKPSMDKPQ